MKNSVYSCTKCLTERGNAFDIKGDPLSCCLIGKTRQLIKQVKTALHKEPKNDFWWVKINRRA